MSDFDREISHLFRATGAPAKVQLRTRYFEEVLKMTKRGYTDDEIDKSLISKLIKESPEEAELLLSDGMSREEVEKRLIDCGIKLDDVSDEELERLRKLGGVLKGLNVRDNNRAATPKRKKHFTEKRKFIFKAAVSAWLIWIIVVFSLEAIDVLKLYREEDYLSWLVLPPIVAFSIYVWVNKFILKK